MFSLTDSNFNSISGYLLVHLLWRFGAILGFVFMLWRSCEAMNKTTSDY
jgi:hypothetical protein